MLENGKTYHVKLLSPWDLEYEVLIVGDTTPENVANFGTFDIRGEFFTKFNIGLKTYTSLLRDDTRIYICRIIESRNPIVIKDKATLFIPATIVNETETIELLNSIDITYRIEGSTRHFSGLLSENNFLVKSSSELSDVLSKVDSLRGDTLSVTWDSVEALYEKPFIENQDIERKRLQDEARSYIRHQAILDETRLSNLVKKSKELDDAKKDTSVLKRVLENRIIQIDGQKELVEAQRRNLEKIKSIMVGIISNIQSGQYDVQNFPSFDELYNMAEDQLRE